MENAVTWVEQEGIKYISLAAQFQSGSMGGLRSHHFGLQKVTFNEEKSM